MAWTTLEQERIRALEYRVNELQCALNQATTKRQLNTILAQLQPQIDELNSEIAHLERLYREFEQRTVYDELQVVDNTLWVYDITRNEWLSSSRFYPTAGRKGRAKNSYLYVNDGLAMSATGYRIPRDATITALSAQTRSNETWTLKIRKNNDLDIDLATLEITNAMGNHDKTIDVNLNEGDVVRFYAETTGFLGIKDPLVFAEIAWRRC